MVSSRCKAFGRGTRPEGEEPLSTVRLNHQVLLDIMEAFMQPNELAISVEDNSGGLGDIWATPSQKDGVLAASGIRPEELD